jgi:RNA polymerase sigma-70 factor (ECF subfamily)
MASPSPSGNDFELAVRAGGGDDGAFAALHARHQRRLVALAERILGPVGADPEGAVQDAWVRAHQSLAAGKRPQDVPARLSTIVRHVCFDELDRIAARPRAARGAIELDGLRAARVADPAEAVVARERLHEVLDDIGALTDGQRRALTMHVLGGDPHEDVSRTLDLDVGAVKALIYRARARLRAHRARRLREELARGAMAIGWPAKAAALAAVAAIGGLAASAITRRVVVDPQRAPAWVPAGRAFVDRAVAPGGRLPHGVAIVDVGVPLAAGERARRGTVSADCPPGEVVVDWLRPAAVDPDVVWAWFDERTRRHRYIAGAPDRGHPVSRARVEYATVGHLPDRRSLTFSVLCVRRTAARDRAIGVRR